jgi:hypothetical protein
LERRTRERIAEASEIFENSQKAQHVGAELQLRSRGDRGIKQSQWTGVGMAGWAHLHGVDVIEERNIRANQASAWKCQEETPCFVGLLATKTI